MINKAFFCACDADGKKEMKEMVSRLTLVKLDQLMQFISLRTRVSEDSSFYQKEPSFICQMSVGTDHKALGSGDRLRLPRGKAPRNDDLKPDSVKFTTFVQIAQILAGEPSRRTSLHVAR